MIRQRAGFTSDPFTDLLFNALLGFTLLFMVSVLFLNPIARRGAVDLKAEFIITLSWPDHHADDLDLWVQDPNGEVVSYLRRDAGWLHLDRDDRGSAGDTIVVGGRRVVHPVNQEVVTVRGHIAGEYVVNIYYYQAAAAGGVPATVQVDKVNPELTTVFFDRFRLAKELDERTAVRFTLSGDGEVVRVSDEAKRLTPYALEG